MTKSRKIAATVLAVMALGGCATTPPVTMYYYLPRADAQVTVIRSLACNANDTELFVANTITSKVEYSADPHHRYPVNVEALDGPLANTELGITLAADGRRLLGFNVTQTGQGSQVVDALLAVAGVALAGASGDDPSQLKTVCENIENNGKEGVLTLTFSATEAFESIGTASEFAVISQDADRLALVQAATGVLCLTVSGLDQPVLPPVDVNRERRSDLQVKLRQPARMQMEVAPDELGSACDSPADAIWSGNVLVPQQGVLYDIPLPRAAAFGKQSVTVSLSEAGALTSLKYGGESGVASVVGSAGKTLDLLNGSTTAERAAALDAQADLIAQQERLLKCQATPASCPT